MSFTAEELQYVIESADRIERLSTFICGDIERLFLYRLNQLTRCDPNAGEKKQLIAGVRQWVRRLTNLGAQLDNVECGGRRGEAKCDRRDAVLDSLARLLRTLDEVDIENLQYLSARYESICIKKSKRKADRTTAPSDGSSSHRERRRRLPSGIRQTDIVQGMHEAEALETDDQEFPSGELFLGNIGPHFRVNRTHNAEIRARVSIRAVLNAHVPTPENNEEETVTTLSPDAAVLRRDLYRYLSQLDTSGINALMDRNTFRGDSPSEIESKRTSSTLQMMIKEVASTLLRRISSHPQSASMRLSSIMALDSLREQKLGDHGYRCLLDELLELESSWSIKFYAEIVSECDAYNNPLLSLRALCKLMQKALQGGTVLDDKNGQSSQSCLLRAIVHIMVRRRILLARTNNGGECNPTLRDERDTYRILCNRLSASYDSASKWVSPTMPQEERDHAISVLQAEGILSIFSSNDGGDLALARPDIEEYPYPGESSLRSTHQRMGPCEGFNRLVSHTSTYHEQRANPAIAAPARYSSPSPSEESTPGILSNASDDILNTIFSYLGYRSLVRASQCCTSWERASKATNLWAQLYFKKYKHASFQEELASEIENARDDEYFGRFVSINRAERLQLAMLEEGYDWKYLFSTKYMTEKTFRAKTCDIVGCSYVICRNNHRLAHLRRRHELVVRAQIKKRNSNKALQTGVAQLQQQIATLEGEILIKSSNSQPHRTIDSPRAVLEHLIFPYLDYRDMLTAQSVCKLWKGMVKANQLWRCLYEHQFGAPIIPQPTQIQSPTQDWRELFRRAFLAHCDVKGQVNDFGWKVRICPAVGCNKELRSKFELDVHVLKHKEKYCSDRIKQLKKMQRDWKRLNAKKRKAP